MDSIPVKDSAGLKQSKIEQSEIEPAKIEQAKIEQSKIEQAKSVAAKYLRNGWGSRAAVFHTISDLFAKDLSEAECQRICMVLDPFHGVATAIYEDGKAFGITVCGALSGALAGFALINGQELPFNFWIEGMQPDGFLGKVINDPEVSPEEKVEIYYEKIGSLYGAYYQMVLNFKEHFGTTDCFELEKPHKDPISIACFRNCARVVAWTAGMACQMLLEYKENPDQFKTGNGNVHLAVVKSAKDFEKNK